MDGEVEGVFIMKSYLNMERVKQDVQMGAERETLQSLEENGAILKHLLLGVTGWK